MKDGNKIADGICNCDNGKIRHKPNQSHSEFGLPVDNASPTIAFVPIATRASPTAIRDNMEKSKGGHGGGDAQGAGGTMDGARKMLICHH